MSNTGVTFGGDILVYRNTGTDIAPVWESFAYASSHSYNGTTKMRQRVHKDDGGATGVRPGRHEPGTIGIQGLVSYDGVDFWTLDKLRKDRERIHLKYSGRPSGDTDVIETTEDVDDKYYEAYGYINEVSREDPVEEDSTYSATITLDGFPTEKTVTA